ncbi:hypothetical protein [Gemmata sp.]|uniref:hypothetical protein n=1 Tax=Gemmata sp. TaxID=1914242 RepID=UPI003F704F20
MRPSPVKLSSALVALAAFLGSVGTVSAAPPPGLRWGDKAFGNSSRTQPATPGYSAAPVGPYYAAPVQPYAALPAAPAFTGPGAVTGQTITIVGADGVARVYPITGGVVQQLPSSSTTAGQVAPGVGGTSTNPGVVIPRR